MTTRDLSLSLSLSVSLSDQVPHRIEFMATDTGPNEKQEHSQNIITYYRRAFFPLVPPPTELLLGFASRSTCSLRFPGR